MTSSRRVGLNAHLLSLSGNYRSAGINGYIFHLLNHLPAVGYHTEPPDLDFIAYLHDAGFAPPAGLAVRRSSWSTGGPWRRIAWEQTGLAAATAELDLLHGLAFVTPLAARCPTVVTVHDLSFLRFPEAFRPVNRLYLSWFTRQSCRHARRVIAVSESTRQDVIDLCGVPAERVVAVPNGVSDTFRPAPPDEVAAFRRRKGLPDEFLLYLGTLEPRKNLVRLVDAYAIWRRRSDRPLPLVIAGAKGWYYDSVFARVSEHALTDQIHFPGFVAGDELSWWYRAASLFVYPSLFEGFGLPVLEALACGTPVITSRASSLPEVAGDAALLVDTGDAEALADAIGRVMADPSLAAQMRAAGPPRAAAFSWRRTAAETVAVYRQVLDAAGPGGQP